MLILQGLNLRRGAGRRIAEVLGQPGAAWAWNAGLAVHVVALTWLGHLESASPQILWSDERAAATTVTALFALRWLGGAAMTAASAVWCARCLPAPATAPLEPVEFTAPADLEARTQLKLQSASGGRPEHHGTLAPDLLPAGR